MNRVQDSLNEKFFRALYRIRRVEEEIACVYPSDKIKSPVHLSIGQESVAVGICESLLPEDIVFGTYRGHAMYLAKGGDLGKMIVELYGKETGCASGKGGSMHLIDKDAGVMGTSAIVGSTIPVSVGYALGLQYNKSPSIVVSFFGDGAVDEGAFHESMNFAALKRIPILFVCENNIYAIHSHHHTRHSVRSISDWAKNYGMYSETIECTDIFHLYERAKHCVHTIRNKDGGPILLECLTYRWREHVGPNEDFDLGYRSKDEAAYWMENDPMLKLRVMLDEKTVARIETEIEEEIKNAFKYAESCSFPEGKEVYEHLFKEM